jgi:NADP-dependent 3-hydroxy acid dehydrogenase YdfG
LGNLPVSTGRQQAMNADRPFPGERTAVVTGAASPRGIGRATADRLARDGWSIAILDLDDKAARRTAAEIASNRSVASLGVAADVADEDAVQAAIAQVEAGLPPIIGLANVAGVSSPTEFLDVTTAEWDRVFDVNMRGTFLVTRRVVPAMVAAGVGRIVSVSSVSAQRGGGTYSRTATSRAAAARACGPPTSARTATAQPRWRWRGPAPPGGRGRRRRPVGQTSQRGRHRRQDANVDQPVGGLAGAAPR